MSIYETRLSEVKNEVESSLDKLRSSITLSMQQKTEFQDLEAIAHKLHEKVDHEKLQELVGEMRSDINSQLTTVKKELKKKQIKKKEDVDKTRQEQDIAIERTFEEIKGLKDKLTRLANTFDKELIDRDKSLKKYQEGLWSDVSNMLTQIQQDTQSSSKLC